MDLVCVLALCHLVVESLHLRFVRDVGDVRGNAQALRQARRLAEPLGFRHRVRKDVTHRDIAAFGDQLADELSAHTRAAAGDDCNPACKILHMSRLPWFSASIDEKRPLASPDVASKPMALVDDFRAQSTLNPAGRHSLSVRGAIRIHLDRVSRCQRNWLSCGPPRAMQPARPYRVHRETVTCPSWSTGPALW